jgi:MFS family permease
MPDSPTSGRFAAFFKKFTVLRSAPRELWIIYGAYILENLAYKCGAASVLTLWLSYDLGFTDVKAGTWIAIWSAIMTLITVLVGSLTDAMGIRRTFLLGFVICLVARCVMVVTVEPWIVLPFGLYMQAVGLALMVPVMIAAVKKFSNAAQRSVAFSLYYALMNLGFACGDAIVDRVRGSQRPGTWVLTVFDRTLGSIDFSWLPLGLGEHGHWIMPVFGMELSSYRALIFLGALFTVPGLLLVWLFLRDGVEMTEQGVQISPPQASGRAGLSWAATLWASCKETAVKTASIFASLWQQPAFYRFLIFMTLVVGVRMIFFQLTYTFPKYGIRELGPGAPFASISGMLNSILILVLVPICGVLTQKVTAYRMVIVGSAISALSVFFIALPPVWFQPLADGWLGDVVVHQWLGVPGAVNPLYISIFLFIVFLSIGEALWSPRLYEYSAAIAPHGQEASYMALSMLPYFGAKLVAGALSGWLLQRFCPAEGPRHSEMIWMVVGGMALITPVGAYLFRKSIQVHEDGR